MARCDTVSTAAWIFFGAVFLSMLPAIHAMGTAAGVRTELLYRLPGGSVAHTLISCPDVYVDWLFERIKVNPIRWAIRALATANFGGGFLFSLFEKDASWFDGIWWAYVTVFTVGYGDLSPAQWVMRLLAMGVMALGWASLGILLSALTARILEYRQATPTNETPELHDDVRECAERLMALADELQSRETTTTKGGRP